MVDPIAGTSGLAAPSDPEAVDWAAAESGPVIVRQLRLRRPDLPMSTFSDDIWSLRPMGVTHGNLQNLRWQLGRREQRFQVPQHLVTSFKRIVWLFINRPTPPSYLAATNSRQWPAPTTIAQRFPALRHFGHYLGEQDIAQLCDVTVDLLDSYAMELLAEESTLCGASRQARLGYISAIAHLSVYLPEADRMVEPTWSSKNLGGSSHERGADNAKAIIDPDTFAPLLWWSQQIVQCAPDIVAAVEWVNAAANRTPAPQSSPAGLDAVAELVAARGGVLPGGREDGRVAAQYLVALWGGAIIHRGDFATWRRARGGVYVTDPALPQPIPVPVTCAIEGRPWEPLLDYREVCTGKLQRILRAAAAVLICSCTGMRGEECRRLSRGALRTVPRPDGAHSFRIDGRVYKAVRDEDGQRDPGGKPWVWATIKPGADAIVALEKLAGAEDSHHLISYPNCFNQPNRPTELDQIVHGEVIVGWIGELIEYANALVIKLQLDSSRRISVDPNGRVTLDRFRRSVAWHVVNQPEGLLAAGVQFGHIEAVVTERYGSSITSGIAATMDHERINALYTTLQGHANAAKTGMKVSGPAAKRLGNAVNRFVAQQFPGTYVDLTKKEERRLRSDPDMVVRENPGHACLCLADPMKPETMACSRENNGEPNRNDCRTYCGSRAYTDATVAADKEEAAELRSRLDKVNPILAARINKRINHLEAHIAKHEATGLPLLEVMTAEQAKADRAADGNKRSVSVLPDVTASEEGDQA